MEENTKKSNKLIVLFCLCKTRMINQLLSNKQILHPSRKELSQQTVIVIVHSDEEFDTLMIYHQVGLLFAYVRLPDMGILRTIV